MAKSTYNSGTQNAIFAAIQSINLLAIKHLLSNNNIDLTAQTTTPLNISGKITMQNTHLTPFSALCVLYKYCPDKSTEILGAFNQMFNIFSKSNKYTNPVDSQGCTEFMWAVWTGNLDLIKKSHELMKQCDNYNVNQQDKSGRTALHVAVQNKVEKEIIKYLINDVGVKVDSGDSQGRTALFYAVSVDDLSVQGNNPQVYLKVANIPLANELLDDGASPNIPYHGKYLLSMLCEYIWRLKDSYIKSTDNNKKAECVVDIKNYIPIVEELIKKIIHSKKFDHTAKDADTGFAAVHWLGELGEKAPALLQELKELGADINKGDVGGRSTLNWYSDYNAPSIVTKLLELKANVNTQAINGETAAHALLLNASKINSAKAKLPTLKISLNHDNKPPYDPTLKISLNHNNKLIEVTAQDLLKLIIDKQGTNEDLNNCDKLFDEYQPWYDNEGIKLSTAWYNEQAALLGEELANFALYE
ncbi:MAG: ankyrin repeat domain-containing protein [Rickettsia endosymbiont of Labidopullus appendiculatus]|nr:ankyrin repeat domain-containing protein [Rickettsia endosymbiont of Labidopullus appendiculatus]